MLRQTLISLTICLSIAQSAGAKSRFTDLEAAPAAYLRAIAESPRGKNDPIILAPKVPIIFGEDGHVLVTDTDCEPYPQSAENGLHQKFKEDLYYSNRICQQAVGKSEAELISWLGKPFPRNLLYRVKDGKKLDTMNYFLGGIEVPMVFEIAEGRCVQANCGFSWNKDKVGEEITVYDYKFFPGKSDTELFSVFGELLRINGRPVKSPAIFAIKLDGNYEMSYLETNLEMKNHKCVNVTGTVTFGDTVEPYSRPRY